MRSIAFFISILVCFELTLGQNLESCNLLSASVARDSLAIKSVEYLQAQPASPHRLNWNKRTTIGFGIMVLSAALGLYCHNQAEQAYRDYLHCGSYQRMQRLFARAQRYDRLTGWAYGVMEVGFVITVFSFDRSK